MPWLVATAFLHSVMVQERRGMLRVWNMVLVILTFSLALFGTFLTRSGILVLGARLRGVDARALLPGLHRLVLVGSVGAARLPPAAAAQPALPGELPELREAVFLFNNLLLVGLAFAVFWGTMFPILSEAARGERITVGQGYYEQVASPIGIALLVLTGVGPLVAWRKASAAQLRRRFVLPLVARGASRRSCSRS